MKRQKEILCIGLLICWAVIMSGCSIGQDTNSTISETTIKRLNVESLADIPFENVEILKSFSSDPQILDYNTVRRLALTEYIAAGFDVEMGWEGYKMNPVPVVIYGFDNKPKFYDFIIIDAEEQMVGTITVYARRSASTSIRNISSGVQDYKTVLTKAGGSQFSLYEDWMGRSYVGLRGKSGETPDLVMDTASYQTVTGITEIEGKEIIAAILNNDFLLNMYTGRTPEETEADLLDALYDHIKRKNDFWTIIDDEILPIIENIENEEEIIDSNSKATATAQVTQTVGSLSASVTNQAVLFNKYYINKYTSYFSDPATKIDGYFLGETSSTRTRWCGPWVVSYLVWIKSGHTGNKFNEALSYTNDSLGKIFGGKPMSPSNINNALKQISNNKMSMNITFYLGDKTAYNRIKDDKKPVMLLSLSNKKEDNTALHWSIAVGARVSGSTYYFLFHDNSTCGRNGLTSSNIFTSNLDVSLINRRDVISQYKQVEWWNEWYNIND